MEWSSIMKRALKILICLFLAAALLVGACWFFLSYRPDLTCRLLVSQADSAMKSGRYEQAVRLYGRALRLNPADTGLAVDLAEAYQHSGNNTKAEYTLVSAISGHPDVPDLYLALSRVYVAQDKLLDADQMLDRIADESVKAQLDSMRPAAPVIQPESGYYTEYKEVSLSYSGGAAYLRTDGDFPSLQTDLYTAPVKLDAGETSVTAVVVSDDGLVSPVTTAGYTIGGVIEAYTFQDQALESCIRTVLGKRADETIMTNELWALTSLDLSDEVGNLSDLAQCHGLTSLTMHGTYGVDFSVLSELPGLETLDLSGCTVSSAGVTAIGTLKNLKSLNLSGCALTDITGLSGLTGLTTLNLSDNAITDLSALTGMTKLSDLNLGTNTIASVAPLAACGQLQFLDISSNQITSIASLKNKQPLSALKASGNQITDLSPLSGCTSLQLLDVSNNQIADLTPIAALSGLGSIAADHNSLTKLPDLSAAQKLVKVTLSNNALTDLSGLADLPMLNYVDVDYNQIASLDALKGCSALVQVDAFHNPVKDVSALTDHGVIVNYDPTAAG